MIELEKLIMPFACSYANIICKKNEFEKTKRFA